MAKTATKRGKGNGRGRGSARANPAPVTTQGVNLTPEVHAQIKQLTDQHPDVLNTMGRAVAALVRGWGLLSPEQRVDAIVGRIVPVVQIPAGSNVGVVFSGTETPAGISNANVQVQITPPASDALDTIPHRAMSQQFDTEHGTKTSDQSASTTEPASPGI